MGINFILLILYFLTNLKILNLFLFKIIGIILILFGIYFFIKKSFFKLINLEIKKFLLKKSLINLILITFLGLYFCCPYIP